MFGFLGRPQSEINWQSEGVVSSGVREFVFQAGSKTVDNNIGRVYYDYDNANAIKANQEALLSTTLVTYTGTPKTIIPLQNITISFSYYTAIGGVSYSSNYLLTSFAVADRRFKYSTATVLSPTSRKIKALLNFYQLRTFAFNAATLSTGNTAASNTSSGVLNLNCNQFPYMEGISINESYISTLNLRFNNPKFRTIYLTGLPNISSITGSLPSNTESACLAFIGTVTSITTLLQNCINLKALFLGVNYGGVLNSFFYSTVTLTGTFNISHLVNLKELVLPNNTGLTSLSLPLGKTDWEIIQFSGLNSTLGTAFDTTFLDNVLASSALRIFVFFNTLVTYSKNIGNSEIASSLLAFYVQGNTWTGSISITTAKPNLKEFVTGTALRGSSGQLNTFATVNITGLTGAVTINLIGCLIADLQLPVNTVCTTLNLTDNKLDIVTNPNLVTQINAMTALVSLNFANGTAGGGPVGQSSTNGLGANPSFASLSNLIQLVISASKVTGTLTLYNGNKLQALLVTNNTGLVTIANLNAHTGLVQFIAIGCSGLVISSLPNTFTALGNISITLASVGSIDLSGKTSSSGLVFFLDTVIGLTSLTFPATQARSVAGGGLFTVTNCASLASLPNVSNLNWTNYTTSTNAFPFNNNALNITFPFGTNNFIPSQIFIQNNGMSSANVDATIGNIYSNATKWDTYTSAKTLNIAGTNGAAGGIYQFSATPTTAKEKIYYLVITKGWTITYN